MKTWLVVVILMLIAAVSGQCAEPVKAEAVSVADGFGRMLERAFGPLPVRDTLVTGVDLNGFIDSQFGKKASLKQRWARPTGVVYDYEIQPDKAEDVPYWLNVEIGVFGRKEDANAALIDQWWHVSAPQGPIKGFGDRAIGSEYATVRAVYNNVYLSIHTSHRDISRRKEDDTLTKKVAAALIAEMEKGTKFATRGKSVSLPSVTLKDTPEPVSSGTRCSLVIVNTDPKTALVGGDVWSGTMVWQTGGEFIASFGGPANGSGPFTATLAVATPMNVIGLKKVSGIIEPKRK